MFYLQALAVPENSEPSPALLFRMRWTERAGAKESCFAALHSFLGVVFEHDVTDHGLDVESLSFVHEELFLAIVNERERWCIRQQQDKYYRSIQLESLLVLL